MRRGEESSGASPRLRLGDSLRPGRMLSLTSYHNPPTNLLRRLLCLSLCLVGILASSEGLKAGITALREADRHHLLQDNFQIIRHVADIPPGVRQAFAEKAKLSQFHMADPGQPFQLTCIVTTPDLPGRRLIFAGISPGYCFIHYEHGGIAYGCDVELFRLVDNVKANFIWGETFHHAFNSLEQLRGFLATKK